MRKQHGRRMLQTLLLEGYIGSRAPAGSVSSVIGLLQRAVLSKQSCSFATSDYSTLHHDVREAAAAHSVCSTSDPRGGEPSGAYTASLRHGMKQELHLLGQQRRGLTTTASSEYEFQSNLTRYDKAKVYNQTNFQRWRDSGRDTRVAADILQEAGAGGSRRGGRPRRGGRGGGGGRDADPLAELRSTLQECRDLRELQVVVRECAQDMPPQMLCYALGRLRKLKEATPSAASPDLLARRLAESLMAQLEAVVDRTSVSNLGLALNGLADCGVLPGQPFLELVLARASRPAKSTTTPTDSGAPNNGNAAILHTDGGAVSFMLLAAGKFTLLQHQQRLQQHPLKSPKAASPPQPGIASEGGVAPSAPAAAARRAAGSVAAAVGEAESGDVLRDRLWPLLRRAAEVKLMRALGEEPEGVEARSEQREREVDDSMPQASLRAICKALALAHDTHGPTWAAATRLTARHVAEIQPAVAAAVLRSYAASGGTALDGDAAGLLSAVWQQLRPKMGELDVSVLMDLTYAASRLATYDSATSTETGGASPATGTVAAKMLRPLCDALIPRVPSLSCNDIVVLAAGLSTSPFRASAAAAAAAAGQSPPPHPYGALPRLLADLLLLRGPTEFGLKSYASVAMYIGLLGHTSKDFWALVGSQILPEVPRMDGVMMSRLLGGFQAVSGTAPPSSGSNTATTSESSPVAAGTGVPLGDRKVDAGTAVRPAAELVSSVHSRVNALLEGADGGLGAKEAFYVLRCLAEWPLPEGGDSTATLTRLADVLTAAVERGEREALTAASQQAREGLAAALRAAGLGELKLLMQL